MEPVRFLGVWLLWLAPGLFLARRLRIADPPGADGGPRDPLLLLAGAFPLAAAVSGLLAFAGALAGASPPMLAASILAAGGAALLSEARPIATRAFRPPSRAGAAVALSLAGLAAAGWRAGASLRVTGDGPDHVGTLREILATGRYFPTEAFHLGAGILGADPRKGLLHPVYAALSHAAGMDPLDFWLRLPAVTALVPVLSAWAALRWLGAGSRIAALGSAATLLTWSGGLGGDYLGISPFPNQLGAGFLWMAGALMMRGIAEGGGRRGVSAATAGFAAIAVHPMYAVFIALAGAIAAAAALGAGTDRRLRLRRALFLAGALALLAGPYLLYRLPHFAPANPIHTERQGMLLLGGPFFVADPALVSKHLGAAGALAYSVVLALALRHRRRDRGTSFFFWSAVAALNLTWNPLLVPAAQKGLTYLIFRSFWLLPSGIAVAAAVRALLAAEGPRRWRSWRGAVLVALGLALLPSGLRVARGDWIARTSAERDGRLDPLPWRADLEALDRALPDRVAVLSDPVTSHVLPAFTSLRVVSGFDQHTSPNDRFALARLVLAGRVLSPATPPPCASALLESTAVFGPPARYILVNEGLPAAIPTATWRAGGETAAGRREELSASPAFTTAAREGPFTALAPRHVAAESSPPPAGPCAGAPRGLVPLAGPVPVSHRFPGGDLAFVEVSTGFPPSLPAARGRSYPVTIAWTTLGRPAPPGGATAVLRLDAVENPVRGRPADKLLRKLLERLRGEKLRARVEWPPTGGAVPPWTWRPGFAVEDHLAVRIPPDLAPGRYVLSLALLRLPAMPEHRLRDYWSDDDLYAGIPVDTVLVGEAP